MCSAYENKIKNNKLKRRKESKVQEQGRKKKSLGRPHNGSNQNPLTGGKNQPSRIRPEGKELLYVQY